MDPTNVLATQGTTILLIPLLVQWLKRSNLPALTWIHQNTPAINRTVSWVLGVVAALGIHWVSDFHGGVFTLSVDFTHLSLAGLLHDSTAVGAQLGGQQLVYRVLRISELLEQTLEQQQAADAASSKGLSV